MLHFYNWRLVYQLTEHGTSFNTFADCAKQTQESLLLIKTRSGKKQFMFFFL